MSLRTQTRDVGRSHLGRVIVASAMGVAALITVGTQLAGPAAADTSQYELYCPGTPIGNLAFNGVVTSGSLAPAAPVGGRTFRLTHYQTKLDFPQNVATAFDALSPILQGSATAQVDATGASPAATTVGPVNFRKRIPTPVPSGGVTVSIPSSSRSVGPLSATGSVVSLAEDATLSLTLMVSGNPLSMSCSAYPNNALPEGIVLSSPAASPIDPVIVTATTRPGRNVVVNPNFTAVGSSGPLTVNCVAGAVLLDNAAANDWGVDCAGLGTGTVDETTELVPIHFAHSGSTVLHVTGSVGDAIGQTAMWSVSFGTWSVWVYPISGPVVACLEQTGNPAGQPTSCDAATVLNQWDELQGTYSGPAVDQLLIGACIPGSEITTTPVFSCPTGSDLTPPISSTIGDANFLVNSASVEP